MTKKFNLIYIALFSLLLIGCNENDVNAKSNSQKSTTEQVETRPSTILVCLDRKNSKGETLLDKDGKPLKNCIEVKTHNPYPGTPIPNAK